jgi:prepilin peptidase CpaA
MPIVATFLLFLVLALAVRADTLDHRIPNELVVAGATGGLLLAGLNGGLVGAANSIGGFFAGMLVLLPFYLLRGMGAGDVKLIGAVGAYLGPTGAVLAAAGSLIAGAVLALGIVALRLLMADARLEAKVGETGASMTSGQRLSAVSKERFPYALAIAIGSIASLWLRGAFSSPLAITGLN